MIRVPAVAGRFYPGEPKELADEVKSFCAAREEGSLREAVACMVPHAGYMYSGGVAGAVYSILDLPRKVILIGPRHFPRGAPQAIVSQGAWQTPLGLAQVDQPLAIELKQACPSLLEDEVAHRVEHALEVHLPFLQKLTRNNFEFVPIALGTVDLAALESIGRGMAEVIRVQK
jgi:AmmeMemoRadiSam system protein B